MRDGAGLTKTARCRRTRRGAQDGATAVEFAMIAAPLFFMIFAILELALVFIVSTTLENAMNVASRRIRTGEFQVDSTGMTADEVEAAFRESICENMSFMADHCQSNLSVDVRTLEQFNSNGAPSPIDGNTFDDEDLSVSPGGESARMLARAYYRWPLATPFLDEALAKADGKAVISSAAVFQNEPYGDGS